MVMFSDKFSRFQKEPTVIHEDKSDADKLSQVIQKTMEEIQARQSDVNSSMRTSAYLWIVACLVTFITAWLTKLFLVSQIIGFSFGAMFFWAGWNSWNNARKQQSALTNIYIRLLRISTQ